MLAIFSLIRILLLLMNKANRYEVLYIRKQGRGYVASMPKFDMSPIEEAFCV